MRVLSTASLMQWLWTIGGGAVVSAAISAALGVPSPWGYVLAIGLFVLVAAAMLALIEWLRKAFQPSLAERIEMLIREGMKLLEELSAPMPVANTGGTHGVRLGPDDAHIEKAFAFHERARELLGADRPSLLPIYADAANDFRRQERQKRQARSDRGLSNAEKMKRFEEDWYHEPAVFVEAFLYGLSAARNKLGD